MTMIDRALEEVRHTPFLALIPLSYRLDDGRMIKTVPATARPQTRK